VDIQDENKTLATITFQNYFRMYKKLSGMTGTALTEESEFRQIYNLDVISIPTNMPMVRQDAPDAVYKTEQGKYLELLDQVKDIHETGQPILVGTVSVEKSEHLSRLFTRAGIRHNVLNARQHEREAEVVAQAGRFGAVTIATNMAGRGTDILLGGNPEFLAKQEMRKQGYEEDLIEQSTTYNVTDDEEILKARALFASLKERFSKEIEAEKRRVIEAGGLCIVGTERHESRRIDNQLRGRAGRQGDPGYSKFFLSLEDDLMRFFGGERIDRIFSTLGVEEDVEIAHPMLSKSIETAQKRIEGMNFAIRKNVLEYDDVMNIQRNLIYKQRREVLEGQDLHLYYKRIIESMMDQTMGEFLAETEDAGRWDREALTTRVVDLFGNLPSLDRFLKSKNATDGRELADQLKMDALARLEARGEELGSPELLRVAERVILLQAVDNHWMDHIDQMDDLRDSIGMRGYAQHDPVIEYKREGFEMFESMSEAIQEDAVRMIMRARLTREQAPARRREPKNLMEGRGSTGWSREAASSSAALQKGSPTQGQEQDDNQVKQDPVKKKHMPGRNEPCWCGSGKKYKNCHLTQDEMESQ
ncbi:MAG TPA: SEC-C metal-binding domain-containing protein, partial [Clostridia bacterium]|nr:SEC-C metal-binding domain-containing protein [Clostridia bacterium]